MSRLLTRVLPVLLGAALLIGPSSIPTASSVNAAPAAQMVEQRQPRGVCEAVQERP